MWDFQYEEFSFYIVPEIYTFIPNFMGAFTDEIKAIPKGVSMAMFGMSLDMADVLVRGTNHGLKNVGLFKCGVLEVDYVYNPMPPVPAQIYPPKPLEAITEF